MRNVAAALILAFLVVSPVEAGSIYSHVDANGNRVFSDEPGKASSEVRLNEATIVSGKELGKPVKFKYGKPDAGRVSRAKVHPQLRELEKREKKCDAMKSLMNSTAGVIKIQTEDRYNRECVLGQ